MWFPPDIDPLTGEPVVRVVQPALDGGDVFAVFVRDVPVALLRETLNAHRLMGELMVLDRHGHVVVHSEGLATQADTSLGRRGLEVGTWCRGFDGLNIGYRDGVFTISHRVRGTDWVLASFWSWRTMTLPLHPAHPPVESGASGPVLRGAAFEQRDAVRVLVVDDHPFNRELLADQLDALGYTFDVVNGGRAAIRQMLVECYDVVLTDVNMPDMDGIALAMCVRDSHPGLPVIAITATKEEAELAACRRAGVVDVLHKPLAVATLDRALRQHVDSARRMTGSGMVNASAGVPLSADRPATLARESARLMNQMGDNLGMRLFDAVRADAHAMKGAFAMIGERAVVELCEDIEQRAREGDVTALRVNAIRLEEVVDETLGAIGRTRFTDQGGESGEIAGNEPPGFVLR